MSYDVSIKAPPGKGYHRELWDRNLTYNLHDMLKAAGLRLDDLEGMTGADAFPHVANAIHWLAQYPIDARALEPDNGWGTYGGCLEFLSLFLAACADHPDGIVSVA